MPIHYWIVDYRGETGWKQKLYNGTEEQVNKRIKRLVYDKIEIKGLLFREYLDYKKIYPNSFFQVLTN